MNSLTKSIPIMFFFDLIAISLSTYFWYTHFNLPYFKGIPIIITVVVGLITLFLKANYKVREFNNTGKNSYLLFEGILFTNLPMLTLLFFTNWLNIIRFIVLNIITIFIALKLYRIAFHHYLFHFKKIKNILILGVDKRARTIADEIQAKFALRMNVIGFVQDTSDDSEFVADKEVQVYKDIKDLKPIIQEKDVDIIVITNPTELLLTAPIGIKIYKMPDFYEMVTGKYYIDEKTMTELYYVFTKKRSLLYDFCKRAYDIIAALIILIVTLPIIGYIALRVKLTDGGNPLFTQTRVGKDGKTFACYKLRTMYLNDYVPKNAEDLKYAENQEKDDRVIPFCKFIRKARFDEIPQMINILKGEMSIVGPRAEWEDEVRIFCEKIPYYSCRMWVKTGWTGWSHINMKPVFTVDEERERLTYDLYYIKHRNVLWEIGILVKAVFLAIGGRHL
jgi:lipopolysaccharide/colanic/teichoic acid biosynthesis glycosyltransferase